MHRSTIFYAIFCLGIVAAFVWAARDGFSPFADGGAAVVGRGAVGPNHK